MKKLIYSIAVLGVVLTINACKGESTEEATIEAPACSYSYQPENSVMEWTSFKYTNRTGVKGTFTDINISGVSSADTPEELVKSLGFEIKTESVETQDPDRNKKIAEFFFGTLNTPSITGKVNSLNENGKAEIDITMNNITKPVTGEYTLEDGLFSFKASIDVINWNGQEAIDALNQQCATNHTGEDGILKLWSEVDLSFSTELKKECK